MNDALAFLRSFSLDQPGLLWLLVLALPLIVLAPRARLAATSLPMRAAILGTRIAVVALILVSLGRPTARPPGYGRAVVFAIDTSDSISIDQQRWARAWVERAIRALPAASQAQVIEFGERAQLADASAAPPGGATDIAAALRLAGDLLPRDASRAPEVVLLTDGWQTAAGSPADALPAGIAVSYLALPAPAPGAGPMAVVHSLDAPSVARAGDRLDIHVDLQAAQSVDAFFRLFVDDVPIANGPIHLEAGDAQLSFAQRIAAPGFVRLRADLQSRDTTSRLSSMVVVKPAGRVLVIEDERGAADPLASTLASQGLQIDRRPAADLPPSAADLAAYDGIVMVDTPATSLTLDQQRTLVAFVQDLGRGLVVVGGPRSFAPGGYEGTVLDDLLPVASAPPVEPQQGAVALFLVIDRSGSMDILSGGGGASGGASKLAMAREAAIEAAGLLQPDDTLGVIAFDSSFKWVVPPTRLSGPDDVKRAQDEISTIRAGGGTSILPPLEAAFQAAANVTAPLKHIVLLTDGESSDRGYEDLIARMAPARITLSTLAIGSDADTRLLTNLAHIGGGRYYFTERSTQIPRIASKETAILTRNAVVDGRVAATVGDPSPILRSISGDLPALSGYVATTRKDRAVTALETERGHPLLAHWQYGLGRVVAWTSQGQTGWASEWTNWRDGGPFWSQAVRWALPAPIQANFQPSARVATDGRTVELAVQSLGDDGHFADLQDTRATVVAPDGSAREVSLPQRGPGAYTLETRVAAPGDYRVLFKQGPREEVAAFSAPDAIEMHSAGLNVALLDLLARTSGGRQIGDVADLAQPANGARPPIDLWPWLLVAALALLPLDVFLRRRA